MRQLPDGDPLDERVTSIKTNLGLSAEDQAALVEAAARLVAKDLEDMRKTEGWTSFLEQGNRPALLSQP